MNIIQITDCHIRHNEPFFKAGCALDDYVLDLLTKETEPFIFLDSGDRFHTSKETGRVNREVVRFFLAVAELRQCNGICVMQGNHDVKEDTGSAIDVLWGLDAKIEVIDRPRTVAVGDGIMYLLPHCRPYSIEGYTGVKSYGDEEFHRNYFKSRGEYWDEIKEHIMMVSMHGGDETSGKLFMSADISFIPGIISNGHVHKEVSSHCLPSAMITRRDEVDKECAIRKVNVETWRMKEIELPLFLNYASIKYGENIDGYFESGVHKKPLTSLIVDIYGHDDRDAVIAEYTEKWKGRENPEIYIGDVTPVERRGEAEDIAAEGSDIATINIKELFREFCKEKKIAKPIADDLEKRLA